MKRIITFPLSVEGRELLKVLDTNIYTPINTSNTLQIRAWVWRFIQGYLWIKEEFTPENSRKFLTHQLPLVEANVEKIREQFSQKFGKIIDGNRELEVLSSSLQTEYQVMLRNQLLFNKWVLQSSFVKRLWNNFEQVWDISPIYMPINKLSLVPTSKWIQ